MSKIKQLFAELGEGHALHSGSLRLIRYEAIARWPEKGVVVVGYNKHSEPVYLSYIKKDNDRNTYYRVGSSTHDEKPIRYTAHPVSAPPALTKRKRKGHD